MEIRKTTLQDVDTVLDVFAAAKRYMRANGNALQWGDEYPDRGIVTYDIACGSSYVMLENGEIVGTFALFLGEDESYRVIEDGAWHLDQPYGTIHCLASNGKACGVSKACFDFCTAQIGYLRADTHADNRPMQRLLEAYKRDLSWNAELSTARSLSSRIIPTAKRRFRGIRMRMCASRSTTATVCTT